MSIKFEKDFEFDKDSNRIKITKFNSFEYENVISEIIEQDNSVENDAFSHIEFNINSVLKKEGNEH